MTVRAGNRCSMGMGLAMLSTLCAGAAAFPAAAAPSYTATRLGTYPYYFGASAINNSGQITGAFLTGQGWVHAFIYSGGVLTDLGTLGGTQSEGYAINDAGQVTGASDVAGDQGMHAFLYSDGKMIDLGTFGGRYSHGSGINSSGQITGQANQANTLSGNHAFLYSSGQMTDLGTLGGLNSEGRGINDRGQIVGWASADSDGQFMRAFLYSGGRMTDLGTLGGAHSGAFGINNHGRVTGESLVTTGPNDELHAFLYADGTMTDLGMLAESGTPGCRYSSGRGINDVGQIVGVSCDGHGGERAFLFSEGRMFDLNALVTVGLGDATLISAHAINDRGQIVALGCDYTTNCQAFRLDPIPGPGSAIEYYHVGYGHYFVTALPQEIAMLDANAFRGWVRTGESFGVLPPNAPGAANVCRFWSGEVYSPTSTHFYTSSAWFCSYMKGLRDWVFEGEVFAFIPPAADGACGSGMAPLYRLYNNGMGGAPNHRYTTSLAIRTEMMARGWGPEGSGIGVIGCVPPR